MMARLQRVCYLTRKVQTVNQTTLLIRPCFTRASHNYVRCISIKRISTPILRLNYSLLAAASKPLAVVSRQETESHLQVVEGGLQLHKSDNDHSAVAHLTVATNEYELAGDRTLERHINGTHGFTSGTFNFCLSSSCHIHPMNNRLFKAKPARD